MQVRLESLQILVTIHIPTKEDMYYVGVWIHLVIHLCVFMLRCMFMWVCLMASKWRPKANIGFPFQYIFALFFET